MRLIVLFTKTSNRIHLQDNKIFTELLP